MPDSNQDRFLQNIRQALGREMPAQASGIAESETSIGSAGEVPSRSREQKLTLVDTLQAAARELQINALTCRDPEAAAQEIVSIVQATQPADQSGPTVAAWNHPLINSLDLGPLLAHQGWEFFQTDLPPGLSPIEQKQHKTRLRERICASAVGLTSADYCLADTATLVMPAKANQARSVSLVPSTHIALIHLDQLLLDLHELFAVLKQIPGQGPGGLNRPYMNLISGPSKTADIEMSMVYGVHGPRTLHLLILT